MTITIQHVPGCPHEGLAVERVKEALARLGKPTLAVELYEVSDEVDAQRVGFRGSPTVLIDGVDPFADPTAPVGLACRLYPTAGGPDGAPSVEQLCGVLGVKHEPTGPLVASSPPGWSCAARHRCWCRPLRRRASWRG